MLKDLATLRSWDLLYRHPSTGKSIFLGDVRAAQNLNFIHAQKITTIITAALGMDHLDYSAIRIKHIVYPFLDCRKDNLLNFFEQFYQIVEKQIKTGNILIHCYSGVSRSSGLLLGYLMRKENWNYQQVFQLIKKRRSQVQINLGFQRQLKMYFVELKNQRSQTPRKTCHSSITRRPIKSINSIEKVDPLSIGPVKYTPHVSSLEQVTSPKKLLDFHVRTIRMRSIDTKIKCKRMNFSTVESEGGQLPNFEVVKLHLSRRVQLPPALTDRRQKC